MPPSQSNDDSDVKALADAVVKLHGSPVRFVGSVPVHVHEQFHAATVWHGMVSLFELPGHPAKTFCYAWSVPEEGEHGERFYAVLHTGVVDSPEKAIRASILVDNQRTSK